MPTLSVVSFAPIPLGSAFARTIWGNVGSALATPSHYGRAFSSGTCRSDSKKVGMLCDLPYESIFTFDVF